MKIKKFMPIIVLSAICVAVTLLLAVVNMFTGPIIEAAMKEKANAALLEVLPDGKNFTEIELDESYPEVVTAAYSAEGGFVFQMSVTGKSSGLVIMCGIDESGKIVATTVISDEETPSYSAKVFPNTDANYVGMDLADFEPYLVSGATLTSRAYSEAVKAALQSYAIANGGEVDLRDPAEILQDNCNLALGTEGKTFEKWFATEEIGVDALYITDGGAVALIYGDYVGITADGTVSTEGVNAETGEKETIGNGAYVAANSAFITYSSATLTEVALPEGAHKNVLAAYVTDSGNYVFELQAAGYGINGEWHTSGEYVKLKVAISAEGKIISTLTTYQSESEGIGDVCADPNYYESFNGKDATSYSDVENVSNATVTTSGYKKAIGYAFEAFEILTGGIENE